MQKDPNFSYRTLDIHKIVPDPNLIGKQLRHSGNGKVYVVTGFAWMGATDEWGFTHLSPEGVQCCRPLSHVSGRRRDGSMRYTFVGHP